MVVDHVAFTHEPLAFMHRVLFYYVFMKALQLCGGESHRYWTQPHTVIITVPPLAYVVVARQSARCGPSIVAYPRRATLPIRSHRPFSRLFLLVLSPADAYLWPVVTPVP
jgi:hypothetical protein